MIVKNRYFFVCVLLIIIQQALVGLSTYFIGLAGKFAYLAPEHSFHYIVIFFSSIAVCYLFGSCSLYFRVKLSNSVWSGYYRETLSRAKEDWGVNSAKNKEKVSHWIIGESLPTIEEASFYYIEIIALYLNVIFTVAALYAVLGQMITLSLLSCMVVSLFLIFLTKTKINKLSTEIQSSRIEAFRAINKIWDNAFFGMIKHFDASLANARDKEKVYFDNQLTYKCIEQVVACLPVLTSIPLIIYASHHTVMMHPYIMGSLVAVLPRSLQLYQSIHAASMHTTQLMVIRSKVKNLEHFHTTLERADFFNDADDRIKIYCHSSGLNISPTELCAVLFSDSADPGRYTITGPNGTGKSSFLKKLKSQLTNAILVSHENQIGVNDDVGSSGEKIMKSLGRLFADDAVRFFLLDEWDANTDIENTKKTDDIIGGLSKREIVIEVRHKKSIER